MTEPTHTPLPVHGYTEQPEAKEVALVNQFKQEEERLLRQIDMLAKPGYGSKVLELSPLRYVDADENTVYPSFDPRWLAIARTHIQEGFMALNRAVFQPQRVRLPEDES